jgi:hypothetical protein
MAADSCVEDARLVDKFVEMTYVVRVIYEISSPLGIIAGGDFFYIIGAQFHAAATSVREVRLASCRSCLEFSRASQDLLKGPLTDGFAAH